MFTDTVWYVSPKKRKKNLNHQKTRACLQQWYYCATIGSSEKLSILTNGWACLKEHVLAPFLVLSFCRPKRCLQTSLNSELLHIPGSKQGYPPTTPLDKRGVPLSLLDNLSLLLDETGVIVLLFYCPRVITPLPPASHWSNQVSFSRGWQHLFMGVLTSCSGPQFG